MEIHPYVQGRLRALPRQEESTGVLLGTSANGVTRITGFRRAHPNALRQAVDAAGPTLAGLYRLQTLGAPTLSPAEADLCRQTHSLFLLVHSTTLHATAWIPQEAGEAIPETISLAAESEHRPLPPLPQARLARPKLPWLALGALLLLTTAGGAAYEYWPGPPKPATLTLDLQSRAGELAVTWQESAAPDSAPESVALTVREGDSEQTMDLTKSFTPHGRVVLRPRTSNVVVTLNIHYPGRPQLSRSATYIGFEPVIVQAAPVPAAAPDPALLSELAALRKRNKELLEAVTAMRKHFAQQ